MYQDTRRKRNTVDTGSGYISLYKGCVKLMTAARESLEAGFTKPLRDKFALLSIWSSSLLQRAGQLLNRLEQLHLPLLHLLGCYSVMS